MADEVDGASILAEALKLQVTGVICYVFIILRVL